jgi:glycerol kinase
LEEIWGSVVQAAKKALEQAAANRSGFSPKAIIALGITNQRETLCVFEKGTGKPLARAIVWQCKRSAAIVERLKSQGVEATVRRKTGLLLDPYFSGTKMTWLMENDAALAEQLRNGRAVMGTIDTYLIARLTGGKAFVTEASNASRTLCFDINHGAWDHELLEMLKVPGRDVLPEVRDSAGEFGRTRGLGFLPDGIPISGVLGDQQAALAGQACFSKGEAKCTYGTGAFLLANLGDKPLTSLAGMLTTVAWSLKNTRTYAFEGSAFIAGAAVQFLRDQMNMIGRAADSESLAEGDKGAPEVYFVPALAGLGAPYWDPKASGAFFGLTRGTRKGQIIRATLEGIAFQVADLTDAMAHDLGAPLSVLRVDGGAAANNLLMQAQADFAQVTVDRPLNLETTAFGAALFAGLGVGIYSGLNDLRSVRKTERLFAPKEAMHIVKAQRAGWQRAVRAVQVFADTAPR